MADLDYAKVTGRFALTVGDTASDVDDDPDTIWCNEGRVIFTPLTTYAKVAGGVPEPFTVGNAQIEASIDTEGYLTYLGKRSVHVVDLTSPKVNPQIGPGLATHRVTFTDVRAGGTPVDFPEATVRLTAAGFDGSGENDLTLVLPVSTGEASPITRGETGTGVETMAVQSGDLVVTLDDGSVVNAGALPVGPGGSDAGVASYIDDPASRTAASLSASIDERGATRFDTLGRGRLGRRWVFLGDSETEYGDLAYTTGRAGDSWPNLLAIRSNGAIQYVFNAGKSGNTIRQQIDRFDTDVTPHDPDVVTLLPGTAAIASTDLATMKADLAELVAKVRSVGAQPVMLLTFPRNDTSANRIKQLQWNDWLAPYAESEGIVWVDTYTPLVDPATGGILTAYDDGSLYHLNAAGRSVVADAVLAALTRHLSPATRHTLANTGTDGVNLLSNALFLTDANADGIPDGYSIFSGSTNVVRSLVPAVAPDLGNWSRITATGATGATAYGHQSAAIPVTAGDRLRFSCRVKFAAGNAASSGIVRLLATGSTSHARLFEEVRPTVDGTILREWTVPAGVTAYTLYWVVTAGSDPRGTIEIAQPRLIKVP